MHSLRISNGHRCNSISGRSYHLWLSLRHFSVRKSWFVAMFLGYFFTFSIVFGIRQSIAPGVSYAAAEPLYEHADIITKLIRCESQGKNVKILDTNGYYSYGILQFQSSTWNGWSKASGIKGSPMVREDAMRMADWAIDRGLLYHWSCAKKLGLLKKKDLADAR